MSNQKTFVLEQLEEALEERQNPDRRKNDDGFEGHAKDERRQGDRRDQKKGAND